MEKWLRKTYWCWSLGPMFTHRSRHSCTWTQTNHCCSVLETVRTDLPWTSSCHLVCSLFPASSLPMSAFSFFPFCPPALSNFCTTKTWCSSRDRVLTEPNVCANSLDKIHFKTDCLSDRTLRRKQRTGKGGYSGSASDALTRVGLSLGPSMFPPLLPEHLHMPHCDVPGLSPRAEAALEAVNTSVA